MGAADFWEGQRQIAQADLYSTVIGNYAEKRAARIHNDNLQKRYAQALEAAKQTGELPSEFQKHVPIDEAGRHLGIKKVLLRELGKKSPDHPMVISPKCREVVGTVTLINYNRANRPVDAKGAADYEAFAPDDEKAQAIFQAFPR
jgi:hypothetical protein